MLLYPSCLCIHALVVNGDTLALRSCNTMLTVRCQDIPLIEEYDAMRDVGEAGSTEIMNACSQFSNLLSL